MLRRLWDRPAASLDQVEACVNIAQANAGYLYLGDFLTMIRHAGKTRVESDRTLKRNLDMKLKASGRFTRLGRYRNYLEGWEPEDLRDAFLPPLAESVEAVLSSDL